MLPVFPVVTFSSYSSGRRTKGPPPYPMGMVPGSGFFKIWLNLEGFLSSAQWPHTTPGGAGWSKVLKLETPTKTTGVGFGRTELSLRLPGIVGRA